MLRLQHIAFSTPSVFPLSSHYQHRISSGVCDFSFSGFTVTGLIKCNEYSCAERSCKYLVRSYRYVSSDEKEEASGDGLARFEEAVKLFNERKYYACHDLLESLWFDSYDPLRTLLHALLQCAVAFYHLFNQNHKGAMMEMGEGLCKLRKLNFKDGPFHEFEQQISSVLNFIYQTQLELAACR
ncbi:uncharacterized protein LOC130818761 isoform X2 [Amaranthus tricolor]|uniref:uncharacterized protein LOC130818761 isoform X2 n=1 Tax=Amaranthus tricolor TaxID=29722 RepID=UPI00258D3F48|nr:uncharacterized protein LOC130818761 isoform X2 [Amaranthus tricolor]